MVTWRFPLTYEVSGKLTENKEYYPVSQLFVVSMEQNTMNLKAVTNMIIELDIDNVASAVQQQIDTGVNPQDILKALTTGMDEVGRRYETDEYFLAELVLAGDTMKTAFEVLKPHLKSGDVGGKTPIVAATVKGDNHDIGKNILISMLVSAGFEVVDLGLDCPTEKIVDAVRETGTTVVALSALLTMTMKEISTVDKALKEAGLRDGVKIIVGGAPLNMELAKELGADDYSPDAIDGVKTNQRSTRKVIPLNDYTMARCAYWKKMSLTSKQLSRLLLSCRQSQRTLMNQVRECGEKCSDYLMRPEPHLKMLKNSHLRIILNDLLVNSSYRVPVSCSCWYFELVFYEFVGCTKPSFVQEGLTKHLTAPNENYLYIIVS
jgi:methylmalonyl-CoA mutase cobalamin-binding domain/chain